MVHACFVFAAWSLCVLTCPSSSARATVSPISRRAGASTPRARSSASARLPRPSPGSRSCGSWRRESFPPDKRAEMAEYAGQCRTTLRRYSGLEGFVGRLQAQPVVVSPEGYLTVPRPAGPVRFIPTEEPGEKTDFTTRSCWNSSARKRERFPVHGRQVELGRPRSQTLWYSRFMDSTIQRFDSLSEADQAESDYYARLTPEQRLEILFELIATHQDSIGEDSQRLERVYRVAELERS